MRPRILLVNPPIYDFTAYDFWARPYGLLRVAGHLRDRADLVLVDFLDRLHPDMGSVQRARADPWGRGRYLAQHIPAPYGRFVVTGLG